MLRELPLQAQRRIDRSHGGVDTNQSWERAKPIAALPGWYEATRVAARERPRLTYDLDVDVCVIGAGLAGLTVAREVARRGWSVAVLEANRVAWAASGRNTGFVIPGFHEDIDAMVERIGLDHTKELWALSEQGAAYVRRTIEETGMPGTDPVDGWLHVSKTDDGREARALVERLRWIGADVEAWSTEQVREVLPSARYFSAVHYRNAFHIHPLNYALGLAEAALASGAHIFEQTPALSIDPAGVRKRIATPEGRVRAAQVVLAGNVHVGALMPQLAATLLPVTTFVMVTEPIPLLDETLRWRGAVCDGQRADNHYRIVGDAETGGARLQWSGRMRVWEADAGFAERGAQARHPPRLPAAARGRGGLSLARHAGAAGASHAADRRDGAGLLGGERLRRPRAQHHGHGRRTDRARHCRQRRDLEAVCPL